MSEAWRCWAMSATCVSTEGSTCPSLRNIDVYTAQERAARGDRDEALPLMRAAVKDRFDGGTVRALRFVHRRVWSRRCWTEVQTAISPKPKPRSTRLASAPAEEGLVIREIWLLRLRALLARAHGDETAYRDYRDRYRAMATSLGFEGHMKWAEAMP